ncbi:MAG: glutathione-disulfide reductase [Porticoccaceae bacterium]
MSSYDYDLFVIGAGSGGVRAARMSAQYGAKVAVAEEQQLGGTCVNVGCIPKKLFVYAAAFREEFAAAAGFGWTLAGDTFHWPTLRDNKDREIARLNRVYGDLLGNAGVDLHVGKAVILDPHRVAVNGRSWSCRHILIATGGQPQVPEFPGREHVITSNDAFHLERLPAKILIVGGGYIAVEFAGIFHGLGVETHVAYRGDLFLRGFDEDLRTTLAEEMAHQGVHLHFNTDIDRIDPTAGALKISLHDGRELTADAVMYATGRKPNIAGLGLENTRVATNDRGVITVDDQFRTAEPSIFALGDVIGRVELTPVAIKEAMVLADNLFRGGCGTMAYDNIPTAVFSQPNMATVGLTEAAARATHGEVRVYRSRFRPLKQTLGGGEGKTLMKLIVDAASDRVVGCHMLGEGAGEIIQGIAIAIKAGATKADFDSTVGIHPTAAEEFVTLR